MDNQKIYGYTSFLKAAEWHNDLIMCNNILDVDPDLLWTDDRFINEPLSEDEFKNSDEFENYDKDYDSYLDSFEQSRCDAYQYFLTDLSESEAEFKNKVFGLEYYYSEKLGLYVMPVYHLGTAWRILSNPIYDEDFVKYNQEMLVKNEHGYCNL